uniref:Heme oxygenase 1 n=1 Tax=Urocitellus parryii TaxID=9999 RepID=A0A8D2KMY7_UROPR
MDHPQCHSLPQDLSDSLKEATMEVHTLAENVEFMRNFQKGQVTRKGFKLVMASLYHVYVALEEEIERNKDDPVFAPLYFPEELHRRAALERDMAFCKTIKLFFLFLKTVSLLLDWYQRKRPRFWQHLDGRNVQAASSKNMWTV